MSPFFSSSATAQVQLWLRALARNTPGMPLPAVDGVYSENTADAVRAFQRAHQLPVTGEVDLGTWNALYAAYLPIAAAEAPPVPLSILPPACGTIAEGQTGGIIYILQAALNALSPHYANLPPIPYTGEFDASTRDAVRQVQQAAGLPASGTVDRPTWNAIARLYNAHQRLLPIAWELDEKQ